MITPSLTKRAAAAGGLALALTAGAATASADPGADPVVNTTCSYSQVVSAMNDQSPDAAAQFNSSPVAQNWLRNFLAAPPPQRQQMFQQAQSLPEAGQFIGLIEPIANTCNNY
jgi:hemophore-related protein